MSAGTAPAWHRGWRGGVGAWGSSRAKDGIQSVGAIRVPVAELCRPQFQDHIRVTLGVGYKQGKDSKWGVSPGWLGRVGVGSNEPLVPHGAVGSWQAVSAARGAPGRQGQAAAGGVRWAGALLTRPLKSRGCRLMARTTYTRTTHSCGKSSLSGKISN